MKYKISGYGLNYIRILLHKYHAEGDFAATTHGIFSNYVTDAEESMNSLALPSIHFKSHRGEWERFYLPKDCFEESAL